MMPELGSFALIIAFCFALLQGCVLIKSDTQRSALGYSFAFGQFLFLGFAFLCLIASFVMNDLTVVFVREHSHQLLPLIYRIGAVWGGHEGSLLLWCVILSTWTLAFAVFADRRFGATSYNTVLMILGYISAGFILFLFATSNPFTREFPSQLISGDDLTPLLQDPGLIFHPPMLYLGYVGFVLAFAFAVSALLQKTLNKSWVETLRPWVILPWSFLSCGIVLGSWWAYRELGWGGWWFWDPVENASLLPWLSATALIHTLIVCEKRDTFKGFAILLAILTFALSLLGTFLVRSGVLVSVHAFASDPTRGLYLLCYLTLIIGGALALYSARIKYFYKAPTFSLFSRETGLLINSVIMLTAVATISLGTLYPIILDALNLEKISVGEPYFNTVFFPIILPLLIIMGLAPHAHWGQQAFKGLWKRLSFNFFFSFALGLILPKVCGFPFQILASIGLGASIWIILSTLQYALRLPQKIQLRHASMIVAHLGIAVLALGITINKSYSEEMQVKIAVHEKVSLAGYQFTFLQVQDVNAPNFVSVNASFLIQKNDHQELLTAEQRIYKSHEQGLSRPGIASNAWRDLYLALGSKLEDGSWSIRIYYKPCVRWIWFGGFMLLVGGLLSLLDYVQKRLRDEN